MSLNFTNKIFNIGGEGTPTLQFYGRGFQLGGGGMPTWQDIILSGYTALSLVNAKADGLNYVKLFGKTEQSNLPNGYTQLKYVQNTAGTTKVNTNVMPEIGDEIEIRFITPYTATTSNYLLQSRESNNAGIYGISGSQSGNTIIFSWGSGVSITSNIIRELNHEYIIKASVTSTDLTLYVKDVTAGTEDTVTRTITTPSDTTEPYFIWGNGVQALSQVTPVYYAKITNNGTVKLNYVAAKDSNNSASFYDLVNNTFITTFDGTITGSTDIATPTPDMPIKLVSNNGVLKVSPNLFDMSRAVRGDIATATGNISTAISYRIVSDFIPVSAGQSYTASGKICFEGATNEYDVRLIIAYYDSNKAYISGSRTTSPLGFTVPDNGASYIRVEYWGDLSSGYTVDTVRSKLQFELGTTATAYMPYGKIYTDGVEVGGWQVPKQTNLTYEDSQTLITAFGGNKYVAITQNGYASTSTDGITWNDEFAETTLNNVNNWTSITYGNNKFVATGLDNSNIIYISTSTNGTTWTTPVMCDVNGNFSGINIVALTYTGQQFVILGLVIVDMETMTANWATSTSTDGTTWTTPTLTNLVFDISNPIVWFGLVYDNNRYIAIGQSMSGNLVTSTSTDGITWTTEQVVLSGGFSPILMLYNNGNFITLLDKNQDTNFYSITSTDGLTWSNPNIETNLGDATTFGNLSFQTFNNENFVYSMLNQNDYWYITTYKPSRNLTETVTDSLGNTATAEMLLKVGTYQDEQSVLDGSVTRNIGIKVLDGTENWNYYSVEQGNLFRITISDSVSENKYILGVLCNKYNVVNNRTNLTLSGTVRNYDFIDNNYSTLDTWKTYLAEQYANGTPVVLVYPLATATTETVTAQTLTTQAGTNTITATGYLDNLALEVSYKGTV